MITGQRLLLHPAQVFPSLTFGNNIVRLLLCFLLLERSYLHLQLPVIEDSMGYLLAQFTRTKKVLARKYRFPS